MTLLWAALFVLSLGMQYASFAAPATTKAYVGTGATSPFELDGNALAQTGHDWDQVYADRNGPPFSSSGASHVVFATDITGAGDDILTGGSTKDINDLSSWLWKQSSSTSVQDKDDIGNAFAAAYTAGNGHRIAYFGLDRYSISGDATAGFWFFKNGIARSGSGSGNGTGFSGVHAEGDILVVMDFSNGGSNGSATVYTWHNGALVASGTSGGECDGTNQTVCATTNIVDATSPWPYTPKSGTADVFPAAAIQGNSQGAGAFYEGGLDMTALGLDQSCYSSFMAETRSSNTTSSTLSDFVLGQFSFCNPPTITTAASPSSITIGAGTVSDTATLSGDNGPVTGSVSFFVCGPNASNPDCSKGGAQVGSAVAISNGSATSADFTPPGVGSYCFRAEYAPDQASAGKYLPGSHTNLSNECFTVTKAKPAITTSAEESVNVGQVISDSAVLSGGYNPTGTITFDLYGPNDDSCSAAAVYTTTATVSGNGTYGPVSYTTAAAGTYRWIASYGGDTKNSSVAGKCNDAGENDVANKLTPTIATTASGAVTVGGSISDTATVSGGYSPTGTVTFVLYGPGDATCSTPIWTSADRPLSAGSATSADYPTTQAGTYRWIATYNGDGNNGSVAGNCNDANESVVVAMATPTITTSLVGGNQQGANITVSLGTAVHDTSVLANATADAGGTVHYRVFSDSICQSLLHDAGTIAVTNGVPGDSNPITFNDAGTYYWQADYSGDANNHAATSACNLETVVVQQNTPTITTQASPTTSIVVGTPTSVGDTATLHNAFLPTGSIAFALYSDGSCTIPVAGVGGSGAIIGNSASYSTSWTPTAPGTYYWQASYAGDNDNAAFTTGCLDANEQLTVIKASPSFTTQASPTDPIVVGAPTQVGDTASFTGGYQPSGDATFALYSDDQCTAPVAGVSGTGAISGGSASYSTSWTPTAPGTYYWKVGYAGDSNNNGHGPICGGANETLTVVKASPSFTTQASPTESIVVGTPTQVGDTANFSGGYQPSGSVSFGLYTDDQCTFAVAGVSGNGSISGSSASFSTSWTPTAVGTYYWKVGYAGDSNNNGFGPICGGANETLTVIKASPSIVTSATEGGVEGAKITDTATVTGYQPSGDVTFSLFGPNDLTCSSDPIFTSANPLDGNGQATSDPYTVATAGVYHWIASYAGDGNNLPVSGTCGDQGETTTISQFAPTITTSLSSEGVDSAPMITVLFGSSVTDQATLHDAGPTAGGTVTYTVFSDSACQVSYADGGTKTVVTGTVPASDPVSFPTAGTYYWQAHYSGDANNSPATSACADEVVTVTTPDLTAEKLVAVNDGTPAHTTSAVPGDTLTYSITITNSGDAAATNVPVTDDISAILAHATFVSCSDSCDHSTSTLSWTVASIAANGGTATVSFVVKLDASFPVGTTTLPNTVVVTGPGSNCAAESDDPACSTTTTVGQSALTIAKSNDAPIVTIDLGDGTSASLPTADEGATVTFTLDYTLGGNPVSDAVITDVLPAGQTYVTDSASSTDEFSFTSYDSTTRTLRWDAATATKSGTVTYQVTIDTGAGDLTQPLVNVATIQSAQTDPVTAQSDVFVPIPPQAVTPPPTDTLGPTQGPGDPGFTLMLTLLLLAGLALGIGFITPVPERVRRRDDRH